MNCSRSASGWQNENSGLRSDNWFIRLRRSHSLPASRDTALTRINDNCLGKIMESEVADDEQSDDAYGGKHDQGGCKNVRPLQLLCRFDRRRVECLNGSAKIFDLVKNSGRAIGRHW